MRLAISEPWTNGEAFLEVAPGATVRLARTFHGPVDRYFGRTVVLGPYDIALHDSRISREHGLFKYDGSLTYTDTDSKNGSFLGNERMASGVAYQLKTGDEINLLPDSDWFWFKIRVLE